MGIYAEKHEGEYKQVAPGTYVARCISMLEIGTIREDFQGVPRSVQKVQIRWELPTELEVFNPEKGEEPFSVSKTYTLSMHEKSNLRKDLESWRGKGFTEEEAKKLALESHKVSPHIAGKQLVNAIYVPRKLVNLVVK